MTPDQCRAGRALLDWSREQLAEASGVAHRTIVDFERGARAPRAATVSALKRALQAKGVVFLAEGEQADGGPGVRLPRSTGPGKPKAKPRAASQSDEQTLLMKE